VGIFHPSKNALSRLNLNFTLYNSELIFCSILHRDPIGRTLSKAVDWRIQNGQASVLHSSDVICHRIKTFQIFLTQNKFLDTDTKL
jgi:hypothetical protein